jgi:hypothetical protein
MNFKDFPKPYSFPTRIWDEGLSVEVFSIGFRLENDEFYQEILKIWEVLMIFLLDVSPTWMWASVLVKGEMFSQSKYKNELNDIEMVF